MEKKRVIKSLENLDPKVKILLKKEYPYGFEDSLRRLTNAKNEPFYVVPLETEDTAYLVKIAVKRNSDGEIDVDIDWENFMDEGSGTKNDDDPSSYDDDKDDVDNEDDSYD